jgi:hypothetical protein
MCRENLVRMAWIVLRQSITVLDDTYVDESAFNEL